MAIDWGEFVWEIFALLCAPMYAYAIGDYMTTASGIIILLVGCGIVLYGMSKIPAEKGRGRRWRRWFKFEGMEILLVGIILVGIGIWLLW